MGRKKVSRNCQHREGRISVFMHPFTIPLPASNIMEHTELSLYLIQNNEELRQLLEFGLLDYGGMMDELV